MRRAGPQTLRRNALIALANGGHIEALDLVERVAATDPDPMLRETAAWAAGILRKTE